MAQNARVSKPQHFDGSITKKRDVPQLVRSTSSTRLADVLLRNSIFGAIYRGFSTRFTTAGKWFALVTLGFAISGVNSLELQFYVAFLYAAIVWGAAILVLPFMRPRLHLNMRLGIRVSVGETLPVEAEVRASRIGRRHGLRLALLAPVAGVTTSPADGWPLDEVPCEGKARQRFVLCANRRGVYTIDGFVVETDAPFGLLRARQPFRDEHRLIVYPHFTPLMSLDLPTGRFEAGGLQTSAHETDSFEFAGNRDYREGDALRSLDWRATARLQRPIVREYREERRLQAVVVLDTFRPNSGEAARDNFERAVSLCAAIADFLAREDYLVELFATGAELFHLTLDPQAPYREQMLEILACVEPSAHNDLPVLGTQLLPVLPHSQVLVCVLLDWDAPRREFITELETHGAAVKSVVTCDEEPTDWQRNANSSVVTRTAFEQGLEAL
jgi:uncharacterized protein (DUF58 family)